MSEYKITPSGYLDALAVHGLKPFVLKEKQPKIEPVADDVEKIREELKGLSEANCPACDLGGCMVMGVNHTQTRKEVS